jgi:hypothetical protein
VSILMGVFIIILAGLAVGAISEIAKALGGRGASAKELADLRLQLEQYAAALADAQNGLAEQSRELAELQERVDFAERLLAHTRGGSALGARHSRS